MGRLIGGSNEFRPNSPRDAINPVMIATDTLRVAPESVRAVNAGLPGSASCFRRSEQGLEARVEPLHDSDERSPGSD